jgi:hypothetical protein
MSNTAAARRYLDSRHHDAASDQLQKNMLLKMEEFLHAYYDLLDRTGGPPDKFRPAALVNEGIETVEHLWWKSLDDDG